MCNLNLADGIFSSKHGYYPTETNFDEYMKSVAIRTEEDLQNKFPENILNEKFMIVYFVDVQRIQNHHPSLSGTARMIHKTLDQARYDFFTKSQKRLDFLTVRDINVVLLEKLGWNFETKCDLGSSAKFTFAFKILKSDIYKYFFVDGVNEKSQSKATKHALDLVLSKLNA